MKRKDFWKFPPSKARRAAGPASEWAETPTPATTAGRGPAPEPEWTVKSTLPPPRSEMFTPEFKEKHLYDLPDSRVTGSGISQEATDRYITRGRREAGYATQQVDPHPNTLIGMSPSTRRYAERKLSEPSGQHKLSTGEPFDIPLPRSKPLDEGPARHRAYAVQVTSPYDYTTYNQPDKLRVTGEPHPSGDYYQANHLYREGIIAGKKPPTTKSRPRPSAITFDSDSD
jgi:hypothetical protein